MGCPWELARQPKSAQMSMCSIAGLSLRGQGGALRPGFAASDLARIFAVNAYLVRDRPAGDDGWRRTLQFTLDGIRT
jgi:hypothetical protein